MNEKQPIKMARFTRRGRAFDAPHTIFTGNMLDAWEDMWRNPWVRATSNPADTRVTGNNVREKSFDFDHFDAMRQGGNAGRPQPDSGLQDVIAGMAAYRLARPASAGAAPWGKIRFRMNFDKFALGGGQVGIFLSNNAAPPAGFDECRSGGTDDDGPDTTGRMSSPEELFEFDRKEWESARNSAGGLDNDKNCNIPEIIGVLAARFPVLNDNPPRSEVFEFDVSHVTKPYLFCHIILSMHSSDAWRTQYFVEGSGFISYKTIEAELGGNTYVVDPTLFTQERGFRVALNMAVEKETENGAQVVVENVKSQYLRYKYKPVNIEDVWYSAHWAALEASRGGKGNLFATGDRESSDIQLSKWPYLAPCLFIERDPSGKPAAIQVRRSECAFSCQRDVPDGMTMWLKKLEPWVGEHTRLKITVNGVAREIDMNEDGDWIGVPLEKGFSAKDKLTVTAELAEIQREDIVNNKYDALGFVQFTGIDLRDAHISKFLAPTVAPGWGLPPPGPIIDGATGPIPPPMSIHGFLANGSPIPGNNLSITGEIGTEVALSVQLNNQAGPLVKRKDASNNDIPFWAVSAPNTIKPGTDTPASCVVVMKEAGVAANVEYNAADDRPSHFGSATSVNGSIGINMELPTVRQINNPGTVTPQNMTAEQTTTQNPSTTPMFEVTGEEVVTIQGVGAPDAYNFDWHARFNPASPWTHIQPGVAGVFGTVVVENGKRRKLRPNSGQTASYYVKAVLTTQDGQSSDSNNEARFEITKEMTNTPLTVDLFPVLDKNPYVDSGTAGLFGAKPQPLVGMISFEGISSDSSSPANYADGMGHVWGYGFNAAKVENHLAAARGNSNIASGKKFNYSYPTKMGGHGQWNSFRRAAGVEYWWLNNGANNVVTCPLLYFTYFLDLKAGESVSKLVIPFDNTDGFAIAGMYYHVNVWRLSDLNISDLYEMESMPFGRAQVNSELPYQLQYFTAAASSTYPAINSGMKHFFFSDTLPVENVQGIYSSSIKTATRLGYFRETSANKLNGAREINVTIAKDAINNRVIPIVLTLAPIQIADAGLVENYLQGSNALVAPTPYNPVFYGLSMHTNKTNANPFSGWTTPPVSWWTGDVNNGFVGPTGTDNQGRPLGIDNPANPRRGFGVEPVKVIGTKKVVL